MKDEGAEHLALRHKQPAGEENKPKVLTELPLRVRGHMAEEAGIGTPRLLWREPPLMEAKSLSRQGRQCRIRAHPRPVLLALKPRFSLLNHCTRTMMRQHLASPADSGAAALVERGL